MGHHKDLLAYQKAYAFVQKRLYKSGRGIQKKKV